MGAVLQQSVNGVTVALAFFSKKPRQLERNYSAIDIKLLILYLGVRYFRYILESQQNIPFTDHKPLTFCTANPSDPWPARQQRQILYTIESVFNCMV